MALLQAREATMRLFRPALAEHGLTEQQWRVLRALAASAAPLEVGELADSTFLLGPSLSRILTNLEGRGLVARRTVQSDQRRNEISLSRIGQTLVSEVAPTSEAIYNRIEAAFGKNHLSALLHDLTQLRDSTHAIVVDHERQSVR